MALSASTVWEVRTGGADTNGGGFVTGSSGTDFSQQNTAQYAFTTVTTAAANSICLSASAAANMVGNNCQIISGINFTVGFYRILSVVVGVSFTLDRNCTTAAGSSGVINIGGALLSPGIAASVATINGMIVYIKNDGSVFSFTSASTNIAGGVLFTTGGTMYVGYQTNRTISNSDTWPTLQTNVSTATQFSGIATMINIAFDGNSQTASRHAVGNGVFIHCLISNFNTASTTTAAIHIRSLATGNSATVLLGAVMFSEAYGNTATPINAATIFNTLSYSNTGASTDGAISGPAPNGNFVVNGFVSVSNGRDGLRFGSSSNTVHLVMNSYFQSNVGAGVTASTIAILWNCGFFGNGVATSVFTQPNGYSFSPITLSGDAFTNLAGNVYSLNNLAGAGAALRALAIPALFPRGLTPNYTDIGAVQHIDSGGGTINIFPIFD